MSPIVDGMEQIMHVLAVNFEDNIAEIFIDDPFDGN